MNHRKFLFLACTLVPVGLQAACSGDDDTKTVYVLPEGGTSRPNDGGGAACEPLNVPESNFAAPATNQKACTDDDIITILDSCSFDHATKQNCEQARQQLAACAACMIGKETDTAAHPGYQYSEDTIVLVSPSACMAAVAKNDEEKNCAVAYGQFETCSLASCLPACVEDTSQDHFESCLTAALNSVCTKGADQVVSDTCKKHYDDTTYGFCTSNKTSTGQDLTDPQYFFAVAKIICGGLESPDAGDDSGIKDAGSDG
jgi:hypothetical protein